MRPVNVSVTGVGVSNPIPQDINVTPFNIGFGVVVTGTVTYSIQHTFDNVYSTGYNPATGNWFTHPDVVSQTVNSDGNYAFPITAMRLNVTAGTGTANLTSIQAGLI
jgi:hypothetical protein